MWTNGGEGVLESIGKPETYFKNVYGSNGCPDKSANGMFEYAKSKNMEYGTIDTLPNIPGLALAASGHVGVYLGNGEAAEERGFNYGCQITKVKNKNWTHWYKLPFIKYGDELPSEPAKTTQLGDRVLKKGLKGEDVGILQQKLNEVINAELEIDCSFGGKTETAVKKFQAKAGITVDGHYGPQTHKMLMSMLEDNKEQEQESQEYLVLPNVKIKEDNINIYNGNNIKYSIITVVNKNNVIKLVLNSQNEPLKTSNDWYAVECADQIGWIEAKYIM